jgi:hypothetical protein
MITEIIGTTVLLGFCIEGARTDDAPGTQSIKATRARPRAGTP